MLKQTRIGCTTWTRMITVVLFLLIGMGCESEDYDHDPPSGKGTLYIDNATSDELNIYINGERMKTVDSWDTEYYDLNPGTYRLVIDGEDTARSFAGDVDVLLERKTIVRVSADPSDYYKYTVTVWYR